MSTQLSELVEAASESNGSADILAYFGRIGRPFDDQLIEICRSTDLRRNVIFMLTTFGGDPNPGYRIARCLQQRYNTKAKKEDERGEFALFINSSCFSTGTLIALGADKLIISDFGEMGPLDIQVVNPDEAEEFRSGLTQTTALESLQTHSQNLFNAHLKVLRENEEIRLTTKTALRIASDITAQLLNPIYSQVDPMQLAEADMLLRISSEYGERLANSNLKDGALEKLIFAYPSHNFVIDRLEAMELFHRVESPNRELEPLGEYLRETADDRLDQKTPMVEFLTEPPRQSNNTEKEGSNA